ncbi:tRNA1(Val) (adenine(37)-N6)-methyltransferase [Pseudaestuariivita atlantica]|uniref:Methyltransferase n=1 Tax=Pseudaestuariivita atlantica TaxID=1317121 RepID=A0A0L1JQM0_9RHOB|nr:methyltransferase [Pseudaestuariivita atlantica]KNG94084.1 methyltransferase [Pseudaestuariivita atlantica]
MSVTCDAFLGGRVHLFQPLKGYRAGVDPVLLAASVEAQAGDTVLDLGCGAGAISLCLSARVPGLSITGVERQAEYAALARRNAAEAGAALTVVESDLTALPDAVRGTSFNHVVTNPPYFLEKSGTAAADRGRAVALAEETPLDTWLDVATRRLAPGGWLWLVHRADRLRDVLASLDDRMGSIRVRPVLPRAHRDATLILVRARKGGRSPLRLLPPIVMHQGASHAADDTYMPRVEAVLRDAAPLGWDDQIPGV